VAFEQPVFVVVGGELADAGAELLERVEAFDPQHLLLERLDELLDDAVGFGLVVEGRAAVDVELPDHQGRAHLRRRSPQRSLRRQVSRPFEREVRRISFLEGNSNQGDALCFEPVGTAPDDCEH